MSDTTMPGATRPTPTTPTATEPSKRTADNSGGDAPSLLSRIGPPAGVLVGFIALWYLYSTFALDERQRKVSLPYLHTVIDRSFLDGEQFLELMSATWVSTKVALTGLAIAMLLGVFFAVLMSQAKWVERSFYPYAVFLQTVPILALVPLISLRFGFGFTSRVLVVIIISLFPIITNTLFGLKAAEKGLHDLFTLHSASRWTRLSKLQIPAAMPAMFTGFQISAGLSVIGSVVGGFFFKQGQRDLGDRIQLYTARNRPSELIAAIFLSAVLGIVMFWLFGFLKDRATRSWLDSTDSPGQ